MHLSVCCELAVIPALAVISPVNAEFLGLDLELVNPVAQGWTELGYDAQSLETYRVHALFTSDMASITAVGDVGGDGIVFELGPGRFFNSAFSGDFAPNPILAALAPDMLWDTFVTIGEEVALNSGGVPYTLPFPGFPEQNGGLSEYFTLIDVGWFVPGFPEHANAVNGRILLAQLTVAKGTPVCGRNWRVSGVEGGELFDEFGSFPLSGVCSPCSADLDGDELVGFNDFTMLLGRWGSCDGCPEDLDGDGTVGFNDLVTLLGAWGVCP